jgi:aspartate/glutamate racemase
MFENIFDVDPSRLFGDYMKVTGVPTLQPTSGPDPELSGKKLGVVNGSSWTILWSNYFGKTYLPGVKIVNVGNEGVQLNFMEAHHRQQPCPPPINIDLTLNYARDLYRLVGVDAVLLSCSTMNRAYLTVKEKMAELNVPVIQIDEAMMEEAVKTGGKICVVATHGPTVKSTQDLLRETAVRMHCEVEFAGTTVEEAFELLGEGRIKEHNEVIAKAIRDVQSREKIDVVILAQLSMTVFLFSYPDPVKEFGIKVLTSGETGFLRAGEILRSIKK